MSHGFIFVLKFVYSCLACICLCSSVVVFSCKNTELKADSVTLAEVWGDAFWRSVHVQHVCYDKAQIYRLAPIKRAICLTLHADERGGENEEARHVLAVMHFFNAKLCLWAVPIQTDLY